MEERPLVRQCGLELDEAAEEVAEEAAEVELVVSVVELQQLGSMLADFVLS